MSQMEVEAWETSTWELGQSRDNTEWCQGLLCTQALVQGPGGCRKMRVFHNRIAPKSCAVRNQDFQKYKRIPVVYLITGMRKRFCCSRGKAKFKLGVGCLYVSSVDCLTAGNESAEADQWCLSPSHASSSLGRSRTCQLDGRRMSKSATPKSWHESSALQFPPQLACVCGQQACWEPRAELNDSLG